MRVAASGMSPSPNVTSVTTQSRTRTSRSCRLYATGSIFIACDRPSPAFVTFTVEVVTFDPSNSPRFAIFTMSLLLQQTDHVGQQRVPVRPLVMCTAHHADVLGIEVPARPSTAGHDLMGVQRTEAVEHREHLVAVAHGTVTLDHLRYDFTPLRDLAACLHRLLSQRGLPLERTAPLHSVSL